MKPLSLVENATFYAIAVLLLFASHVPAPTISELGLVNIRLEGIREKCLVEELPEKTVALVKFAATMWSAATGTQVANSNFQLLATVKDPSGHIISRQQSKPDGRLFITASVTGDHLFCFQAIHSTYAPNTYIKLSPEVLIGEAGDPHITAPIEADLHDLSFSIARSNELVADVQREQALHRERQAEFRAVSERVNGRTVRWALVQVLVLGVTCLWQMRHLRQFFRAKKLV